MLLIYTHKITPRLTYVTRQLFTRILGIEVSYTNKVEDFIKHAGPKVTYTKQPLQNEFFIRSNDLLFEQGVNDFQINVEQWEGVPCFFAVGERSSVPFDIFAASFFLLSRYEEYLPHVKDMHCRFSPKDSLAYQHGFLQRPVVDIWAFKLLGLLQARFPDIGHKKRKYRYTSIIDVTTSHCYAHRGFTRNLGGLLMDIASLQLKRVFQRMSVWINPKKDPYDNFDWLVGIHKEYRVKSMFFFQFADYSTNDKNVSPNNNKFRFLIKYCSDYSTIALSASYSSRNNVDLLRKEKRALSEVIHRPINYSRLRYNRVDVPLSYRHLVEAEFTDDFTMGYTHEPGFRAGTCTSFYFYDINLELQQPIRVHPFVLHDYAFVNHKSGQEILDKVDYLYQQIKGVNGDLVTVFSNELLGGDTKVDWKDLYRALIKKYHV